MAEAHRLAFELGKSSSMAGTNMFKFLKASPPLVKVAVVKATAAGSEGANNNRATGLVVNAPTVTVDGDGRLVLSKMLITGDTSGAVLPGNKPSSNGGVSHLLEITVGSSSVAQPALLISTSPFTLQSGPPTKLRIGASAASAFDSSRSGNIVVTAEQVRCCLTMHALSFVSLFT